MKKTLYKKDASGATRVWSCQANYEACELVIEHGVLGGVMSDTTEFVETNESGRSIKDQVDLRFAARVRNKKDAGYSEELETSGKNQLGLIRPMLAHKYKGDYQGHEYIQPKLNGHRCLIRKNDDGSMMAYSRKGREINTIGHILDEIRPLIESGTTLDGELYIHGVRLNKIGSYIKKLQPESLSLVYHVYDIVSPTTYTHRLKTLVYFFDRSKNVKVVQTRHVTNSTDIQKFFREFREQGYEGAMLRCANSGYEDGKRSQSLLKVKEFDDDEFEIVDIILSERDVPTVICKAHNGMTFGVVAPGTHENRLAMYHKKFKYIGRTMTVQYAELTEYGIPFHGTAIEVRDDV